MLTTVCVLDEHLVNGLTVLSSRVFHDVDGRWRDASKPNGPLICFCDSLRILSQLYRDKITSKASGTIPTVPCGGADCCILISGADPGPESRQVRRYRHSRCVQSLEPGGMKPKFGPMSGLNLGGPVGAHRVNSVLPMRR